MNNRVNRAIAEFYKDGDLPRDLRMARVLEAPTRRDLSWWINSIAVVVGVAFAFGALVFHIITGVDTDAAVVFGILVHLLGRTALLESD